MKEQLIEQAKERIRTQSVMDAEYDNILNVLNREFDETHTHSKLIYYLLDSKVDEKRYEDSFLSLFFRQLDVPENYLSKDKWTIYRERSFDDGRIDFVLESSDYLVAIEMKLGAGDGSHQLKRYDRFCKSRRKDYGLYYLTLNGREPSEQSVKGVDLSRFHCISFDKDITGWLENCINITEPGGYKYSFIKQYLGAVRQITDKGAKFGMDDLIKDSESAFAVIELNKALENKIADVTLKFLTSLVEYIKDNTNREFEEYDLDMDEYFFSKSKICPGYFTVLDEVQIGTILYRFYFYIEITENLYMGFGFDKVKRNGDEEGLDIPTMKKKDALFCEKCLQVMDSLHIRDFKKEDSTYWAYIENTKGEKLNFKRMSSSVIDLIDDMDIQVEYIGDYISYQILNKI